MRRFFRPALIAAIVLLGTMASCEKSRDISGRWQTGKDDSAMVWEFSPGGSVQMGSTRGRYTFGDRDRLKIEMPSGTSVYQMELLGDHMTLKDPNGSKLEFTRVR